MEFIVATKIPKVTKNIGFFPLTKEFLVKNQLPGKIKVKAKFFFI